MKESLLGALLVREQKSLGKFQNETKKKRDC